MRLPSLLFFILLSSAPQIFASTLPVNISTTGFGPVNFGSDSFSLDAYSGTVVLDSTAPVIATVNKGHFSVIATPIGINDVFTNPFDISRMLTVDSTTHSVSQPGEIQLTFFFDHVKGYASSPTAFNLGANGSVDVTLNDFLLNVDAEGAYDFDVTATFAWTPPAAPSVPEPTSLALLGIGMAGLALRRRNRLPA